MTLKLSAPLQISVSTAQDSANYFTGPEIRLHTPDLKTLLPSGTYRVIDDQLFQIIEAAPRNQPSRAQKS